MHFKIGVIKRCLALLCVATPAVGLEFTVPGDLSYKDYQPLTIHKIATGPSQVGSVPSTTHEGPVQRFVWQIPQNKSALALFQDMLQQVAEKGFNTTFSCHTRSCGGFDFRFGIDVSPAPAMFVDLNEFYYLAAHRDDAVLSLVVSQSNHVGYIELILVGGPGPVAVEETVTKSTRLGGELDFVQTLETVGSAIIEGLEFSRGKAEITSPDLPAFQDIADYLVHHPNTKITLVGHTDAEGTLENNMSLSERRAQAVRDTLINRFFVKENQLFATGIGYLSPRTSNATYDGRALNRRVEVVITSFD